MEPADYDDVGLPRLPEEQPNTSTPKTIGILNIVFGTLLLMCVFCAGLNLLTQSAMGPMMAWQQQQFQQAMQEDRQDRLDQMKAQEMVAGNEEERAALRAKQKALQAQPLPKMPDLTKLTEDVRFQAFTITDFAMGLVLNVLMVISGIGLLGLKEWGRLTAIWVAVLKITCLVGLYSFFIFTVVPAMVKQVMSFFEQIMKEAAAQAEPGQKLPGPAEMEQFGTLMGVMMSGFAVGMIIFGVIYPIIVLIVLTRPRVRAAFVMPASDFGADIERY